MTTYENATDHLELTNLTIQSEYSNFSVNFAGVLELDGNVIAGVRGNGLGSDPILVGPADISADLEAELDVEAVEELMDELGVPSYTTPTEFLAAFAEAQAEAVA